MRRWAWWTVIGIFLAALVGFGAWRIKLALPDQLRRIEAGLHAEAARYGIGLSYRKLSFQPLYLAIHVEDVTLIDRIANLPLGSARTVDISLSPRRLLFGESPVSRIRVRGYTFRFGEADRPVLDRILAAPSTGGTIPDILLFDGIVRIGPLAMVEQLQARVPSVRIRPVRFFGTRITFAVDNASGLIAYPVAGEGGWPLPSISGDLLVKDNVVNIRRFRAEGPAASLRASGRLDLARKTNDLKTSGSVDIARWISTDAPGGGILRRFVREGKGEFSASLKGALADPAGSAKLSLRNGRFEGVDAAELEAAAVLSGRKLQVGSLKGTLWRGSLAGAGSWDLSAGRGKLELSLARAAMGDVPWPRSASGWRPGGTGSITVSASGSADRIDGSATLSCPDGIERNVGGGQERIRLPLAATVSGAIAPGEKLAEIGAARLRLGVHEAAAEGEVDWGARTLSLAGSADSPSGRAGDFGFRENVAWRNVTCDWEATGEYSSLSFTAQAAAGSFSVGAFPPVPFSVKAEGNLSDVVHFAADVPADLARVTASGTLTPPLSGRKLQANASVIAREIDLSRAARWLAAAPSSPGFDAASAARYFEGATGKASGDFDIGYSESETTASGTIRSAEAVLRGVALRTIEGAGSWKEGSGGTQWQASASAGIAGASVRLSGAGSGARAEFEGSAERLDIARASALLPGRKVEGIRGVAAISLKAKSDGNGRFDFPEARLSIDDLFAAGVSWGSVKGEGSLGAETGRYRFESSSPKVRVAGGITRGEGMPISFHLAGEGIPTSHFVAMAGKENLPSAGAWDLEADGSIRAADLMKGPAPTPASISALRFRISGTAPSVSDVSFGSVAAEGRKEGDELTGEIRTRSPEGRMSFAVGLQEPYAFRAEGPFSFGSQGSDAAADGPARIALSGKVALSGALGEIEKTTGTLQVDSLRYREGGIDLTGKDLVARMGTDGIRLAGGTLVASGNPVSVAGKISWKGELDARLEGKLPAAMVRIVTDVFDRLDGVLTMSIRVSGKLDNPSVVGTGHLEGGVFSFKGYGQLFEDMKADAIISREKIVFEHFEGRSGGGYIDGRGELPLAFDAGQRMYFSVDFLDMRYPYPEDFHPVVQGHAELFGPVEDLLVTGDVEIQSARYTKTIRPQRLLLDFKRRLADVTARRQKDDFRVRLDVNVVSDGTIEIRNNLAKATAKGEFKVAGDTSRVVVLGAFDLIEGKIEFQGDVYDVKHLGLDFNDPRRNNPRIDARAETKKNNYLITVLVTGTLEKYEVDLVSDPPLGKNDIVSLLSLGVTSQTLAGQEGSVGASLGTSIILGPYKGRVEEGIRGLVGLDKLAVEAAFSSSTKTFEPRFIAGKTFGERLTLSVSTLVGATSDSSANAEFKLLENVFLQGSWQSATTLKQGDMGADIKFKYRYRTFGDFLGRRD